MVGIVTGSGLGLDKSSLQVLNDKGGIGKSSDGKAGESIYVNAFNGNLIIRDQDEMLLGQGVGASIFRSYNSQDGWREGTTPTMGELTGTLNAVGSTVTRTDWDGARTTYTWDGNRGAYVSMVSGAAGQTISGDGTHWTLRDEGAHTLETYDASAGRLLSRSDFDGNTTQFAYNSAGQLTTVTTGSQESVTLIYDSSNRLISLSSTYTDSSGSAVTSTRTRYGYDSQGRLVTVTVDLSPEDSNIADGNVYTTTYSYDGTSDRVAAIQHPDGSSTSFRYQGQWTLLVTETTASGVVSQTSFGYSGEPTGSLQATVQSAAGGYSLVSDANGHVTRLVTTADGGSLRYAYDTNGRVILSTDELGRSTSYLYDVAGNLLRTVDSAGNVVDRTYGTHDELLSERRYTAPVSSDANGAPTIAAGANTTQSFVRYAYDAEQHLRFTITAEGRVTEYRYNAAGQQTSKIVYTQATFSVDPSASADEATESRLTAWLGTIDKSAAQRTDIQYDFRGQISVVMTYQATLADGTGLVTGSLNGDTITRYVYDVRGHLLQRYTGPVNLAGGGQILVESDTYDGLGRLTSTTNSSGALTVFQYSESSRTMVQRFANGLVRTSTYDTADRLASVVDSGTSGAISRTTYTYDMAGRLVAMTDPNGGVHSYVYDARIAPNLVRAEIDATGRLTTYTYDSGHRLTGSVTYATPVDAQQRASIVAGNSINPTVSSSDRHTWVFHDANDRVVKTVDGEGDVIDNVYDATGQLTMTIARATRVDVTAMTVNPTLQNATAADSGADRITRLFHDRDGLLVGQLDAEGHLVETRYDAGGRRKETIAYANAVPEAQRAETTLEALRPPKIASDIHSRYIYDDRGWLTDEIDGAGNATHYAYDDNGNVMGRYRGYQLPPDYSSVMTWSFAVIIDGRDASATGKPIAIYVDGVLVETLQTPAAGQRTTTTIDLPLSPLVDHVFTYDTGSAPVDTGKPTPPPVRFSLNSSYLPVIAHSTGDLLGQGTTAQTYLVAASTILSFLLVNLTDFDQYTYDGAGRVLTATTITNDRDNVETHNVYDAMGRLVETRSNSTGLHSGMATMYRYDLEGHVTAKMSGSGVSALDALGASPTADQIEGVWNTWATHYTYDAAGQLTSQTDAAGSRTVFFYDADGRLKAQVNALGEASLRDYDAFGNLVRTTAFGKRLAAADVGALSGGAYDDVIAAKLATIGGIDASVTTMSYTASGRMAEVNSPLGHVVRYVYDSFGDTTQTSSSVNTNQFVQTNSTFDHLGRLLSQTTDATGLALTTQNIFDAFGRVTETIDANGVHRLFQYDGAGNVIAMTDGSGVTSQSTYDALGRVLSHTDGNGHTTTYQYLRGAGIRVTTPEGVVTTQALDAFGHTITLTDGEGHVTRYAYDPEGHLLTTVSATGWSSTSYDTTGHAIRTYDASGRSVAYSYDAVGRVLTRTVDPDRLNLTTAYTYDARGNAVTTTDPAGRKVTNRYDLENQVVATIVDEGGLGLTTSFTYDLSGHVVRKTEGDASTTLRVTQYNYDSAGRLLSTVVDPDGMKLTTTYTYDGNGNVVAVKDAAGQTTRTVYDGDNRAIYGIDPLGAVTQMTYDANGNLLSRTAYATAIDPAAFATQVPTAVSVAALVVSVAGDRITRYAYDTDNRLRFTQQPSGVVTEQAYDRDGNVVRSGIYTQLGTIGATFSVAAVGQALAGVPERATHYIYDAAGRQAYRIDPAGMVTATTYDPAGIVTSTTAFATTYTGNTDAALTQLQTWAAQVRSVATDHVTRTYQDTAGRTAYSVDAGGYVTSYLYDASGNVVEQRRYSAAVTVSDGTTTAAVAALVSTDSYVRTVIGYDAAGRVTSRTDGEGDVTQYGLDALDRVVSQTDAFGTSAAAITTHTYDVNDDVLTDVHTGVRDASGTVTSDLTTQYVYDAMGRRIQTIDPRGVQASNRSDSSAAALAVRKALAIVDTAGNGKAGANLTDADIALIRSYYTTSNDYDAVGRVVATHSPYGGLSVGHLTYATVTTSYDVFGDAVKVVDARGGVGYFYYDKAGQVIGQVDPVGHYTQTVRDLLGNVVSINAYAGVSNPIDPKVPPAGAGALATTTLTYDVANRLLSTRDAMGGTESYTYDGFGNRTSVTNKLGGTTSYQYDRLGRMTRETLPTNTTTASGASIAVVNAYEYDSRGNRTYAYLALGAAEERDTLYRYDRNDHLTATYTGDLTHISHDGSTRDGVGVIVEQRTYDPRGNLLTVSRGALPDVRNGVHQPTTSYYYDQANRQIAQASPDGAYMQTVYDAAGNKVKSLAYIAPVQVTGGSTPPAAPTPFARETDYTYDAANRLIAQYQPNVTTAQAVGGATTNANFTTGTGISQSWSYDASGDLVAHTDGAGHVTRTWFDALGHAILSIDGNGYPTVWTRDADGNVLTETRYATKYAGDPAAIVDPLAVTWAANATTDRTTTYTYDLNGRVLTQTVKGVSFGSVDGNGVLTKATADAVTTYAYDAAGNLLRQTDANGSLFASTYDLAGRKLADASPSFTDYAGHLVQVTTAYVYDAHNDVVRETRSGGPTIADQVSTYQYDRFGNVVSQTNAAGITTTMTYDAWNNLVRLSSPLTDANGVKRDQVITITYDAMNRETSRITAVGGVAGIARSTRYDVFGEVTGRGVGGIYQETTDYDLAGRVLRTNADQGRTKVYLYDGNGNATIAIESQASDLANVSVLQASGATNLDAIFGTPGLAWTMTVYDGKNEVVDIIQPTMDLSTAYLGLQAQQVPGGGPGQISVGVGGPVGPAVHVPGADGANALTVSAGGVAGTATASTHWEHAANWTYMPSTILLDVDVPDMSAIFGAYTLRIVAGSKTITATSPPYSFHNVAMPIPAVGAWTPSGGDAGYTLSIYVTPRSTGVEQLVGQAASAVGHVNFVSTPMSGYIISGGPGNISLPINLGSPKLRLSPADSAQFNAGAAADQIYIRPTNTSLPYANAPIVAGNPATVDIGFLPAGQYDVLYVSVRGDGSVVRTDKYLLTTGAGPQITGQTSIAAGPPPATQVFGGGTYIMTADALVGVDMFTSTGGRVNRATFAYRPWGSAGGYSWSPSAAAYVPGYTAMSLAGIANGDYEVIVYMTDAAGNVLQQLNGRMIKGNSAYISLAYPAPPNNNITLTNLPPSATSASIVFTSQSTGQQIATGALAITTPGSLAWTMPQGMLDASGMLTNWTATITFSDSHVQPATTYTAVGTITVGPTRPQVPFGVNVQGNLFTLSFNPVTPGNQPVTAGQYMVLRFWQNGADIANHPELIQRRVIQKNASGQYAWDSIGLDPSLTYAYNYDVYATLAETQNAASANSLSRSNGYFTPKNDPKNQEAHWVISGLNNKQVTVHRSQAWDAFGDVISETDGNGNKTDLAYNALGKLTARTEASVSVTYANGYQALVRPTTQYFYDLLGRQIGATDANNHTTTQTWNDALNKVATEFHADGGVVSHQYDAMGNERVRISALGIGLLTAATARRTDYSYDILNRLVRSDGPVVNGQRAFDTYTYDEMDRRVSHTNVLGTDTVAFDVEGNVSAVTSAGGRTTTYTTVWNATVDGGKGGWVLTTTLPYNMLSAYAEDHVAHTLVDVRSSFGQALSHTDGGGRVTTFSYYFNGLLKQQGNSSYTYYNNGLLRTINDDVTGIRETFEYDNNGNVTFDGLTNRNAQWAFQQSVSTYDSLNRLVKVVDPRYTINYEYDAMGNRIHMMSVYTDGLGKANQVQDYWYEYDMMNRFTVTMGQLSGGVRGASQTDANAHVVAGTSGDGINIGYDAFGQRISATYAYDSHNEHYDYDAGGYLTVTTIRSAGGTLTGTATRTNDLAGRVTHYVETSGGQNVQDLTHVYDADSLVMKDIDNVASATVGHETGTTTDRLADGSVKTTNTYGQSAVTTTTYNYIWFDSEKQSEIHIQGNTGTGQLWKPGLSKFVYDSEGRLVSAIDVVGQRAFQYQTDGEGRILQRDELLNVQLNTDGSVRFGDANRSHSYYYMDGNQIGNVGNDGPERIDYARELSEHMAQSANKDDSHKRFTPVAFADFDANYQPINSTYPGMAPSSYIVHAGDTLASVAQAVWGDSSLWWMLADANNLTLDSPLVPNTVLTVPNKVTNIHNNNTTVRPYDPGKAIGNTQPTLPDAPPPPAPPKAHGGGCGGILQIVALVVAVVATVYLGPVALALVSEAMGTTVAAAGIGTVIAAGAVAGAAGAVAGQAVMIAGGAQNGFDWKGIALGAIGGGVAAGIGGIPMGGQTVAQSVSSGSSGLGLALAQGAGTAAASSVVGSVIGLQSFSWRDVAASAVAAGAAYGVGTRVQGWSTTAQRVATGIAAGVGSSAVYGNLSQNWQGIARSVVGNTIGNAIADQVVDRPTYRFDVSKGGQGVGSSGSGYSAGGLISDGPAFVNVGSQEWGALPDGVIPADGPVSYDGALALDEANRMPGQSQEVGTYPLIGTSLDGQRISFQGAPAIVANLQEPDGRSGFLYKDDTSTFGAPDRSAIRSENLMAASTMTSTVGPEQGIWGDLVGSFKAWRAGDIGFGQASSMFLSDFKYHLQTSNKVQGSVRVGAGVLELAGDVLAAGATEGAGIPLLVVSAAHAGDNIGTGFSQLLNDEPAENLSYSGTLALTGSPRVARAVDQGVPLLAAAVQTASISNGANLATGAVTRLSASELEDFNAGAKSFAAGVPDKVSPPNLTERGTLTNLRPQDISVSERPIRALVQDDSGRYWLQSAGGNRITPSGSYDFVTMPDGTIRVARPNNTWDFSTHLGLSGGGEVNWAGSIRFGNNMGPNRGTILEWTNNSGHYQPPAYLSGNAGLPNDLFRRH